MSISYIGVFRSNLSQFYHQLQTPGLTADCHLHLIQIIDTPCQPLNAASKPLTTVRRVILYVHIDVLAPFYTRTIWKHKYCCKIKQRFYIDSDTSVECVKQARSHGEVYHTVPYCSGGSCFSRLQPHRSKRFAADSGASVRWENAARLS